MKHTFLSDSIKSILWAFGGRDKETEREQLITELLDTYIKELEHNED